MATAWKEKDGDWQQKSVPDISLQAHVTGQLKATRD